jgi:hypothetical protein
MLALNGSANPAIVLPLPGVICQVDSGVPGSSFSHTTGLAQSFGFASACASELLFPDGEGEGEGDADGEDDGEGEDDAEDDGVGDGEDEGEGDGEDEGEGEAAGATEAARCIVAEEAAGAIAVMAPTIANPATRAIAVDEATSRTCLFRARTRTRS